MKAKNLFLILVGLIVVIIGLYYFVAKKQAVVSVPMSPSVQQVSQTPPVTPTSSDWKTYTDTKFGYSISYPSNVTPVLKPFDPKTGVEGYDVVFGGINFKVQGLPPADVPLYQKVINTCPPTGPCSHQTADGVETMTTTIKNIQGTSFLNGQTFFVLFTSLATTPSDKEMMTKMLGSFKFIK